MIIYPFYYLFIYIIIIIDMYYCCRLPKPYKKPFQLEIDRYIGSNRYFSRYLAFLPSIGYCKFWLYFFISHIHNYTEYNQQWNVVSVSDLEAGALFRKLLQHGHRM